MKLLLTDKQKKTISKLLKREIDLSLAEMRVESEDWGLGEMDEFDEIASIDNILVNRLEFSDNTILVYLDIFSSCCCTPCRIICCTWCSL